jgi:hypothetical protein
MASTAVDLTTESGIRTLAEVGEVWKSRGHVIRVAVKDAGHGVAIDMREHVTADAYTAQDFANAGKPVRVGKGKAQRFVKKREPFVGASKKGLWLGLDAAEELYALLGAAIAEAVNHDGR